MFSQVVTSFLGWGFIAGILACVCVTDLEQIVRIANKQKNAFEIDATVKHESGVLRLSWDAANPELAAAQSKSVIIRDGDHTTQIPLRLGPERESLEYQPLTNDVTFTIRVQKGTGEVFAYSVRAVEYKAAPLPNS